MSILLFEGFDLHAAAYSTSTVPNGLWDYQGSPYWTHGTLGGEYPIVSGYASGRALEVKNPYTLFNTSAAGSSALYRVSWWGRWDRNVGSAAAEMLCYVEQGDKTRRVGLRMSDTTGQNAVLAKFSGSIDFTGTLIGSGTVTFSSTWAHYELVVNTTDSIVQVYKNGTLQASSSGDIPVNACTHFGLHAPGGSPSNTAVHHWDHIVISNGATLRNTTGYHAAAVTYAAACKDTADGVRVRGRLRIAGVDYFATERQPRLIGGYGPRAMNVYYDYWMTNPNTTAAWGATLPVEAWGICRTDNTGGHVYFPNCALSYVQMVSGYPQVLIRAPGTDLIIEANWRKTHATAYWTHVDNFPRTNPPYDYSAPGIDSGVATDDDGPDPFNSAEWGGLTYDELFYEDYISVTGPGCLVFTSPDEPPADPVFSGLGITFAEEYRDNYKDWQTVDNTGEDFLSYFITGYRIHGDGDRPFLTNYVTINYETHASGAALIQGLWEYSLNGDTNRWGSIQQIYMAPNDVNYKHAFRKLKIRGQGKAMQMKVKSQTGLPFFINGWSIFVSTNELT